MTCWRCALDFRNSWKSDPAMRNVINNNRDKVVLAIAPAVYEFEGGGEKGGLTPIGLKALNEEGLEFFGHNELRLLRKIADAALAAMDK